MSATHSVRRSKQQPSGSSMEKPSQDWLLSLVAASSKSKPSTRRSGAAIVVWMHGLTRRLRRLGGLVKLGLGGRVRVGVGVHFGEWEIPRKRSGVTQRTARSIHPYRAPPPTSVPPPFGQSATLYFPRRSLPWSSEPSTILS